jgi:hypothetical protein
MEQLTTRQVIKMFPELKRDQLYLWERQRLISPVFKPSGTKGREAREYPPSEISKIAGLSKGYKAGFRPRYAANAMLSGAILSDPRWQRLLQACNDMWMAIFVRNRDDTLKTVAQNVKELMDVEAATIFLVSDERENELVLEASAVERSDYTVSHERFKIQSIPKGGLTGHLANLSEVVAMNRRDIAESIYRTGRAPGHLKSGECTSILIIPSATVRNA